MSSAEQYAVAEINSLSSGVWVDFYPGRREPWAVNLGSAGGDGETLLDAMMSALHWDGLGDRWMVRDQPRRLSDAFREIADRHLGGVAMPASFGDDDAAGLVH
ncbi:MAG: hypothetical protein EOP35_04135 [Rubrivivax sp.]|nr:MAG: hypothetical protein EOP35_04135 [Rubrivivax sp.]